MCDGLKLVFCTESREKSHSKLLQQALQEPADQYCLQEIFSHDFPIGELVAKAETKVSMV